jgi:sugar phosphate isomerase/epimerase
VERRTFLKTSIAGVAAGILPEPMKAVINPSSLKLGIISDEADPNLAHVIADFVPRYHLHWIELRFVKFDRHGVYLSTAGTPTQIADARRQLDDADLKLSVLDTPVYKISLPGTHGRYSKADQQQVKTEYSDQLELLKRASDAAHQLGTRKLRIFGFLRVDDPSSVFDRVVEELHKALRVAHEQDVLLVFENEFDTNIATGAETAKLFKAIPDRRLCHNWDPGNAFAAGDVPYPNGWNELDHSRICHMHLKDAVKQPNGHTKWMPIGSGSIDYVGQFHALEKMHYEGTMSLETHYRNPQHDPWTSSIESMDGLMKVLKKA